MSGDADVIVVGAGIAGLVATAELVDAGRRVILVDQEPGASLGGQGFWSFGGLFFVDSPEQRRIGIHDSRDLAWQDWLGTAGFDRAEDDWPRRWAEAYVDFAAGEKRPWLHSLGMRWFPVVGWAERRGSRATGPGNSVPRFHVTWGTGPAVIEPFVRRVREGERRGLVSLRFRHRVSGLSLSNGVVDGVRGEILEASTAERGVASSRVVIGEFGYRAQAVIVTSGGIGANHELVRANWPSRLGPAPRRMLAGVPDHVDGRMLAIAGAGGAKLINMDRMWHYPEGIENHTPVWSRHGIRILSGPSPLWLDANGRRLPDPLFPGFDTFGALSHITRAGHGHSWFVLNQRIIGKEFALSGSDQNPDLTNKSILQVLRRAFSKGTGPVREFQMRSRDFVTRNTIGELARAMNELVGDNRIDAAELEREVRDRDRDLADPSGRDMQIAAIRSARSYLGDKIIRVTKPHAILDPAAGPLIAVRLHVVTRKTLGGLQTDLDARVLRADGTPLPGLWAAGEVTGFGGGGMHGYRALEGTFLGGCLFSGRTAGRTVAGVVGV